MARRLDLALVDALARAPHDLDEIVCLLARISVRGCHASVGFGDLTAYALARGAATSIRQVERLLRAVDDVASALRTHGAGDREPAVPGEPRGDDEASTASPDLGADRSSEGDRTAGSRTVGGAKRGAADVRVLPPASAEDDTTAGARSPFKRHKTFRLARAAYELSERVLERVRRECGRDISDSEAYERICAELDARWREAGETSAA